MCLASEMVLSGLWGTSYGNEVSVKYVLDEDRKERSDHSASRNSAISLKRPSKDFRSRLCCHQR